MSTELLGEWLTYASFAVPGMFWFVGALWVDWRERPISVGKNRLRRKCPTPRGPCVTYQ